jgi:ABC-type lipoprotein release transport system permease subunit
VAYRRVSWLDLVSFGGAVVIVLAILGPAALVPSWRAVRTNPLSALRHL